MAALWICARLFTVTETGHFAFWMTTGGVIALVSDFGLSEQMLRSSHRNRPGQSTVREIATVMRGLTLLLATGLTVLLLVLSQSKISPYGLGALTFGISLGLSDFLGAARRSHGESRTEIVDSLVVSGGALALAASSLLFRRSVENFSMVLGFGACVLVLLRSTALLRSAHSPYSASWGGGWALVRESRWLWPRSLLGWLFLDLTVLLLGLVSSASQVAVFAGAARLVGLVTQPMIALGFVFLPALAHEQTRGAAAFRELARRLNFISLLLMPGLIASALLLGRVALASLGPDYQQALPVLWILVVGYSIYACVLSNVPLIVLGRERLVVWSMTVGQVLLAMLVFVLAPSKGAIGAAIAVLVGLSAPKALILSGYRQCAQSLGGPRHLILLAAIAAWAFAVALTTGVPQVSLLIVGAFASASASWSALSRTTIRGKR